NSNPIPGQTIILCPTKKSGKWTKWMEDFLKENHVLIEKMTPTEHDKTMNIAQGLIHFAEITFADALRRCRLPIRQLLQYTGKASELKIQLAARIIAQDSDLYGNIQIENPYALKSLGEFQKSVTELFKIVQKKDFKDFKNYFEKNKKFYGKYSDEAYADSSYLIDKLMELKAKKQKKISWKKPDINNIAV
ncbi:MAG: prephenate dehydrogenase dimerization domain-containing protein, partial [Patescibacteria group bacterium]